MFNFIIIKKLLNFWSWISETDINIDIILHLKKNSLGGWYPIDTKSKSFSRLHPTVNILLIPLSTLGDRYVKQQFNRPTQRINIKAYKPIPRPIIHYPKDGQIKPSKYDGHDDHSTSMDSSLARLSSGTPYQTHTLSFRGGLHPLRHMLHPEIYRRSVERSRFIPTSSMDRSK